MPERERAREAREEDLEEKILHEQLLVGERKHRPEEAGGMPVSPVEGRVGEAKTQGKPVEE